MNEFTKEEWALIKKFLTKNIGETNHEELMTIISILDKMGKMEVGEKMHEKDLKTMQLTKEWESSSDRDFAKKFFNEMCDGMGHEYSKMLRAALKSPTNELHTYIKDWINENEK